MSELHYSDIDCFPLALATHNFRLKDPSEKFRANLVKLKCFKERKMLKLTNKLVDPFRRPEIHYPEKSNFAEFLIDCLGDVDFLLKEAIKEF